MCDSGKRQDLTPLLFCKRTDGCNLNCLHRQANIWITDL